MTNPGNRRIDRVLAGGYTDDLASLSLEELRRRRHEAEQEETDLSYIRRLLQGRLDILRAELVRREGGGSDTLLDVLPGILADDATPGGTHGLGRHATVEPTRTDSHRRYVEALIADVDVSDLASHDDAALLSAVDRLAHEEQEVSRSRREVQAVMDTLTTDVGRRYRDGDAQVADLLPTEPS